MSNLPLTGANSVAAAALCTDQPIRRPWAAPTLAPHSTMTELTKVPLPQPLSLLFLQLSTSQCFDQNGVPVTPCPPT
jgi:hypothetical protein